MNLEKRISKLEKILETSLREETLEEMGEKLERGEYGTTLMGIITPILSYRRNCGHFPGERFDDGDVPAKLFNHILNHLKESEANRKAGDTGEIG